MRQDSGAQWPGHTGEARSDSVDALVARALGALTARRPHTFDDATVALAQRCATHEGQRSVTTTLRRDVVDATAEAWVRGWQPADVHRMAGRTLDTDEQALALDAVSDELDRYAPSTVDPRWSAQVADLGGGVWWPRSQTWLEAHRARGVDWLTLLSRTLVVLHLLRSLPTIERLGPLPGTVRRSGPRRSVDDRVLARVRMLLAKAESTTFDAEAETFTAGAQALMARHSIDAALVAADDRGEEGRADGPQGRRIGIDTPYDKPKALLLDAVSRANGCRMVWSSELGFGTVMGFESDLDGVELLFTSLLVQANARLMAEGTRADGRGRSRTRAFRQSFLTAYAHRIGERLREVTASEVESARSAASSRGRELVPLLAARAEEVDRVMGAWFPRTRTRSAGSVRDTEGWHVGREAADQARLDGTTGRSRVGRGRG